MLENSNFIKRKGILWLVVADGGSARILSQLNRGSPLTLVGESAQVYGEGLEASRYLSPDGDGRRPGLEDARALRADRQDRFLSGIADLINLSACANHFEHLVIAAPARALGALRAALNYEAASRVRAHFSIDLVKASKAELAEWLAGAEPQEPNDTCSGREDTTSAQHPEMTSRSVQIRSR